MQVVECILIENCLAPKRVGNSVAKKGFNRGQRVRGTVTNIALTPDSQVLALKTKDGYIIPEPFLNILGAVNEGRASQPREAEYNAQEFVDAEIVEDTKPEESSIKSIVNGLKTSDIIASNSVKSKLAVNFALGGAAVGLVYAMMKGGNKLVFTVVGAFGGGIIGNYVGKKMKKNETTK